jgi:hypothetical protein
MITFFGIVCVFGFVAAVALWIYVMVKVGL